MNTHTREILVVDDEVGIRELLVEILQDEGYRVAVAENAHEARAYRARLQPALVLLDIWMPDTDGVTLLREWGSSGQLTMPVVMMSGHGTIETAVEATRMGAFDFLEKPVALAKLLGTITRALKSAAAREPHRVSLSALGTSAPVREAERQLEALVAARRPVLILGETGTGHEIAAQALRAGTATAHEPHRVAFYLHELASLLHAQWNRGKDAAELRFVNENKRDLTCARLALIFSLSTVLAAGLGVLGVSAPDEMR